MDQLDADLVRMDKSVAEHHQFFAQLEAAEAEDAVLMKRAQDELRDPRTSQGRVQELRAALEQLTQAQHQRRAAGRTASQSLAEAEGAIRALIATARGVLFAHPPRDDSAAAQIEAQAGEQRLAAETAERKSAGGPPLAPPGLGPGPDSTDTTTTTAASTPTPANTVAREGGR